MNINKSKNKNMLESIVRQDNDNLKEKDLF